MAFDNNPESLWISNGAAPPGMQWIGYEFPHPVFIGSVQISTEEDKPDRLPALMYVESSCEKYFRQFVTQWVIFNPDHNVNKRYNGKRKRLFFVACPMHLARVFRPLIFSRAVTVHQGPVV